MAISAISSNSAYADYATRQAARAEAGQGNKSADETLNVTGKPSEVKAAPEKSAAEGKTVEKTKQVGKSELSPEELAQIAKLAARDREVRAHEAAHLAASGGLATSGASFSYQKGPDGVNYAVGGEVSIDTSPGRTPEETIQKAQTIQAAALAPAEPSGADRAVAAAAQQLAAQARLAQSKEDSGEVEKADGASEPGAVKDKSAPDPVAAKESRTVELDATGKPVTKEKALQDVSKVFASQPSSAIGDIGGSGGLEAKQRAAQLGATAYGRVAGAVQSASASRSLSVFA